MSDPTPLIGEPLALDLVNTRPAGADLLSTPEDLARWLRAEADRLPEPPIPHPADEDLRAVRAVRDHTAAILEAVLHGHRPPADALRGLDRAQSAAPAVRYLEWHDGAFTAPTFRAGPEGARLAAVLAEAAVDLLIDPAIARLKRCEADDCVMLFLPAHPRRRWCSPQRCGNRVRVARYYDRHRDS
ncbi:CGNR zinc finger domain-containing protein [Nocardia wallacei]|uniref:CGNR zinc finger domain-containing protein n=1 Tax=Nocardia wallacei TaxID=480035 RepID=UPI00245587EF|nr:CGNR zinc finger domain-containing protein [Nocardia wallacei]